MRHPDPSAVSPQDLLRAFVEHPRRWLVPALLAGLAAVAFAMMRPRVWEASQTLTLRDEVSIDSQQQFNSTRADETKAAQETILELAHSQSVLRKALEQVGPDNSKTTKGFPTARDVEDLADTLKLVPPKGGEFGKTDIFYLKSQNRDRQRALDIAKAVSEQLQASFEEIRRMKASSLISELEKTVAMAQNDLDECTQKLTAMERQVGGSDLGELRIMNELPSGMSDLRNESFAIESELRKETNERLQNEQLLSILKAASVDPSVLVACPNSLLNAQPGLKRLKDGVVDAQIRLATLLGSMSADHPQVQAATESTRQIGESLHQELAIAIRAIEADLRLSADRVATLDSQKAKLQARFDHIAEVRAGYSNLAAMAKHRGEILKSAEMELAEARSQQAATNGGALLQLVGEPVTGTRPVGPGNTMLVLAGILGGLVIGLGIIVLTAQPSAATQATPFAEHLTRPRPLESVAVRTPSVERAAVMERLAGKEKGDSLAGPSHGLFEVASQVPAEPLPPAASLPGRSEAVPIPDAVPVSLPSLTPSPEPVTVAADEDLLPELPVDFLSMGAGYPPEPITPQPPALTPLPATGRMTFREALERISAGRM